MLWYYQWITTVSRDVNKFVQYIVIDSCQSFETINCDIMSNCYTYNWGFSIGMHKLGSNSGDGGVSSEKAVKVTGRKWNMANHFVWDWNVKWWILLVYLLLPKSTRKHLFRCLWNTSAACTREHDVCSTWKSQTSLFLPKR